MPKLKRNFQSNNSFHRDADGNAMIFVVLVLFTLVCFFVFTIHIGQRFTNKVEMQNAADASVISGAVWKARGLNLISILNVSMSECLALIIMFKAFDSTLQYTSDFILPVNKIVAEICCDIPYSAAVCCPWLAILKGYEIAIDKVYSPINNIMKRTWKSPKILWKLMSGLKKVSDAVSIATSVMSYIDASRIAKLNGADAFGATKIGGQSIGVYAVLWPYQYKLPVKDGSFEEDLCEHTWNGGEGYNNYLCYDDAMDVLGVDTIIEGMWTALSLMIPPPILTYEMMKQFHYKDLCSTSSNSIGIDLTLQESTMQCDKCLEEKGEATWERHRIELTRNECDDRWTKEGTEAVRLDPVTLSDGQQPEGTLLYNGRDYESGNSSVDPNNPPGPCRVCNNLKTEAPLQEGQPPRYFAEIWALKSCLYDSDQEIEIESEDHDDDKVPPLVLKDGWEEDVKYTSLVFKNENSVKGSYLLGDDGEPILSLNSDMSGEKITYGQDGDSRLKDGKVDIPEKTWAVARAEVYNPGQKDLFNQNWHARLAPVDVKGIQTKFLGLEIELPESITDLANDAVEEVWAH